MICFHFTFSLSFWFFHCARVQRKSYLGTSKAQNKLGTFTYVTEKPLYEKNLTAYSETNGEVLLLLTVYSNSPLVLIQKQGEKRNSRLFSEQLFSFIVKKGFCASICN